MTIIKRLDAKANIPCWMTGCQNKATVKVPDDAMDVDICEEHYRKEQLEHINEFRFNWRLVKNG